MLLNLLKQVNIKSIETKDINGWSKQRSKSINALRYWILIPNSSTTIVENKILKHFHPYSDCIRMLISYDSSQNRDGKCF